MNPGSQCLQAEVQQVFGDGTLSLHTRSLKYGKVITTFSQTLSDDILVSTHSTLPPLPWPPAFPRLSLLRLTLPSPADTGHTGNSTPFTCEALQEPLPQHALWSQHHPRQQWLHLDQSHHFRRSPAAAAPLPVSHQRQLRRERRKGEPMV